MAQAQCFSLIFKGSELPLATNARDNEAAVLILLDETSLDKLVQQVECCISVALVSLHPLDFLLKDIILGNLSL